MGFYDGKLSEKLTAAKRLVFFTGAGMSAESGVPTFRGEDGIWKKFSPRELANVNAFMENPALVTEWYQHRRKIVRQTEPNAGHVAIARLEKYFDVTVVTQNVDNLHRRAGSSKIYELHGNLEKNYCMDCGLRYDSGGVDALPDVPRCSCGGLIRPDIVWFGEPLPTSQFSRSESAIEICDILFIIGTSGIVYPAAYLPANAKKLGKYLVEINPMESELSGYCDEVFRSSAAESLTAILKLAETQRG